MVLFGGTSTKINCIGSMNLCAKFHAFSTICNIPLRICTICLHHWYRCGRVHYHCGVTYSLFILECLRSELLPNLTQTLFLACSTKYIAEFVSKCETDISVNIQKTYISVNIGDQQWIFDQFTSWWICKSTYFMHIRGLFWKGGPRRSKFMVEMKSQLII